MHSGCYQHGSGSVAVDKTSNSTNFLAAVFPIEEN